MILAYDTKSTNKEEKKNTTRGATSHLNISAQQNGQSTKRKGNLQNGRNTCTTMDRSPSLQVSSHFAFTKGLHQYLIFLAERNQVFSFLWKKITVFVLQQDVLGAASPQQQDWRHQAPPPGATLQHLSTPLYGSHCLSTCALSLSIQTFYEQHVSSGNCLFTLLHWGFQKVSQESSAFREQGKSVSDKGLTPKNIKELT